MTNAGSGEAAGSRLAPVLEFKRAVKPEDKFFWSVTFECTAREVLSVQVSNVGDSREDKLRIAEILRNLSDDIECELGYGPQT